MSTTTPDKGEAERLAGSMVEQKLAVCVQIVPQITSVYVWNGEVKREGECLLLIKTSEDRYDGLERFISENHSYEVPEIVAVQVSDASKAYSKWLTEYLNGA